MAAGTRRIGRAEGATNMAAFTRNIRVRAIEHKARTEVVERILRPGVIRREQADRKCSNQK